MSLAWHPFALFIVLFLFFGLATVLVNFFTVKRFDQYPLAEKFPFVSILVPARNEALNIADCVDSLLAQDYPDFEVIVLNDNSTDDTSRILAGLAQTNPRLRVLKGSPLPDGWLGKHWACHQLDQAAAGELILFTDADRKSVV
jgi:chlorobactene glucosyltransferase